MGRGSLCKHWNQHLEHSWTQRCTSVIPAPQKVQSSRGRHPMLTDSMWVCTSVCNCLCIQYIQYTHHRQLWRVISIFGLCKSYKTNTSLGTVTVFLDLIQIIRVQSPDGVKRITATKRETAATFLKKVPVTLIFRVPVSAFSCFFFDFPTSHHWCGFFTVLLDWIAAGSLLRFREVEKERGQTGGVRKVESHYVSWPCALSNSPASAS